MFLDSYEELLQKISRKPIRTVLWLTSTIGIDMLTKDMYTSEKEYTKERVLYFANSFLFAVSLFVYPWVHRTDLTLVCISIPCINGMGVLLYQYYTLFQRRHKIGNMLKKMDENVYTYSHQEIFIPNHWLIDDRNVIMVTVLAYFSSCIGYVFVTVGPIVEYLIGAKTTMPLPYPGWFPWSLEGASALKLSFTYLYMVIQGFLPFWNVFVMQSFVIIIVLEFYRQNLRLGRKISSLEETQYGNNCLLRSCDKLQHVFERNLKECIQHHHIICELYEIFNEWFLNVFFIELATGTLTFAALFYCLFNRSSHLSLCSVIGCFLVLVNNLFLRCLMGEICSKLNDKIAEAIFYNVRWYDQDFKNRRLLLLFHSKAQRPLRTAAFSTFHASFATFTSVLRKAYSFLNILNVSI